MNTDRAAPALLPCPFCGGDGHTPPEIDWFGCGNLDCDVNPCADTAAAWNRRAVLAERIPREPWQPIATAPRDRKVIVGYKNRLGNWRSVMGHWYAEGEIESDSDGAPEGWYEACETNPNDELFLTDEPPTHWMSLPDAPSAAVPGIPRERDAERYRWLCDNAVGYAMHMGAVLYTPELVIPRDMARSAIDAAIDTAIAGDSRG
jgi:hypothetical protein